MKITEKQVIDQQKKRFDEHKITEKGYLESRNPEDNLIKKFTNWEEIKKELGNGNGNELENKFLAIHSSSALCVNNFAPFKENKDKIYFCGYSNFYEAEFEKKLWTGISTPNLDFYLENSNTIIGIESKFTEYFNADFEHTKNNLCKYYNRKELNYLHKDFMNNIVLQYISESEKMYLDVAQLIKHSIGLINESKKVNKKAILVYIFWEPENWQEVENCKKHKKELDAFSKRISKFIEFQHFSYSEFWKEYENCELVKKHIALVKQRYEFAIK